MSGGGDDAVASVADVGVSAVGSTPGSTPGADEAMRASAGRVCAGSDGSGEADGGAGRLKAAKARLSGARTVRCRVCVRHHAGHTPGHRQTSALKRSHGPGRCGKRMPPGIDAGSEVIATQTACAREDRRATPSSARRAGAQARCRGRGWRRSRSRKRGWQWRMTEASPLQIPPMRADKRPRPRRVRPFAPPPARCRRRGRLRAPRGRPGPRPCRRSARLPARWCRRTGPTAGSRSASGCRS